LGRGRREAVHCVVERGTAALGLRRGLLVAILSVLVLVLIIVIVIKITRQEVLKHGQPYSGTGIGHGRGMA
jgi:hypothetical protein